jgi:glycosyltransferase involved in cell wall biosynthesis
MKLSVIIPCYNAAETISEQLDALINQNWSEPWELIIADNGCSDETINIVENYKKSLPNLRIIDASKKKGASHARNVGANAAKSEALAFCDADDVVEPGWVAAMGEALFRHDFVGGHNEYWKLNESSLVKNYGYENGEGVTFNHPYLPYKGGGNLGIKRSIHQAVGGFDETVIFLEDCDYCWRVQLTGVELKEETNAIIQIRLRPNIKQVWYREYSLGIYEGLLYKRHQPFGLPQMIYWTTWIKSLVKLFLHFIFLKIRDKKTFNWWLKYLAHQAGQLVGCVKFRYMPGIFHPGIIK